MKKRRSSSRPTRRSGAEGRAPRKTFEPVLYVFDTGALIAAERRDAWVKRYIELVERGSATITTPAPCLVEWWAGRSDAREALLRFSTIDLLSVPIFEAAGVARAMVIGATPVDAIVMATASLLNGTVVTRDVEDFELLQAHFPDVAVFGAPTS
jgi:predicted nucleic acid-binding protein